MYEKALRNRYRYHTALGALTVEDLWDLPLTAGRLGAVNLDEIAIGLDKQLQDSGRSFVVPDAKSKERDVLQDQLEIVKHIISVRMKEAEDAAKAKDRRERKQKIMEIMADKDDAKLRSMSKAKLEELLAEL